jgi:hypothetical protein
MGKQEGKRPLRRPRLRWVDNVKIDLREVGLGGMEWIDLGQVGQDKEQCRALLINRMNIPVP